MVKGWDSNLSWGIWIMYSGIGPALLIIFVIGFLIFLWGLLTLSTLDIFLGVIAMIVPAAILMLSRVLMVDPEDRFLKKHTGTQEYHANTYTNPYQGPPIRPSMRPEPGKCAHCGGKLFLGRENCPHCGVQATHRG
jgi:hypothetical protein